MILGRPRGHAPGRCRRRWVGPELDRADAVGVDTNHPRLRVERCALCRGRIGDLLLGKGGQAVAGPVPSHQGRRLARAARTR